MAQWTHALCIKCWNAEYPEDPVEDMRHGGSHEHCCMCSDPTEAGLWIRRDPALVEYDREEER